MAGGAARVDTLIDQQCVLSFEILPRHGPRDPSFKKGSPHTIYGYYLPGFVNCHLYVWNHLCPIGELDLLRCKKN